MGMIGKRDAIKKDLESLIAVGDEMHLDLALRVKLERGESLKKAEAAHLKKVRGSLERNYQRWYTEAVAVVRQLIPHRLGEFEELYRSKKGGRKDFAAADYCISEWLQGVRSNRKHDGSKYFDDIYVVFKRMGVQVDILKS